MVQQSTIQMVSTYFTTYGKHNLYQETLRFIDNFYGLSDMLSNITVKYDSTSNLARIEREW